MLRADTITARLLIGIGPPRRPFSSFGAMAAPAIPRIVLDPTKICDGRGSIHARFALPNVRFAHFEAQVLHRRSATRGRATARLDRPWRCRTAYFASADVLSADAEDEGSTSLTSTRGPHIVQDADFEKLTDTFGTYLAW